MLRLTVVLILATSVSATSLFAQGPPATTRTREPEQRCGFVCLLGRDFEEFATSKHTALALGSGFGLSMLATTVDAEVAGSRINSEIHHDTTLDRFFEPWEIVGGTAVQLGASVAVLGVGKIARDNTMADMGSALVRAQLLNGVVTAALKLATQRERPDGSNARSFPSGHTSGSFATAAVLHRRFGWRAGVPSFAMASLVGASRLSENKHYLSDVFFGAAVGLAAGLSVGIDKAGAPVAIRPLLGCGGMGLEVVFNFP